MPLFDTHAHLHFPEFADDLDAVLERARAAGIVGMVTIGTDHETNPAALALAERLPDVYATVGIHPHDAAEATEADFEALESLARSSAKVVATDCPFLPPHPHRGKRNEPAYLALTAARVAELRGVDLDSLRAATTRNAARLFRLSHG